MEQTQDRDAKSGLGSRRNDARLDTLPEDCISMVVYHTSPRDACVVASVSKTVKSAAESDLVWEKFLPQEYSSLVPRPTSKKKEIYMSLADDPVLIEDGRKSFWLEKGSGKKCYMLSAMCLKIAWIDTPEYWQWKKDLKSKFEKVAELRQVYWFEIQGKIGCGMLSKGTHYCVYAVVKRARRGSYGLDATPMEAKVGFAGKDASTRFVLLEPRRVAYRYSSVSNTTGFREVRSRTGGFMMRIPIEEERETDGNLEEPKERGDGWSEVKLGSFYINDDDDDDDEIEFSIVEIEKRNSKSGLILQGIEIRPMKEGGDEEMK